MGLKIAIYLDWPCFSFIKLEKNLGNLAPCLIDLEFLYIHAIFFPLLAPRTPIFFFVIKRKYEAKLGFGGGCPITRGFLPSNGVAFYVIIWIYFVSKPYFQICGSGLDTFLDIDQLIFVKDNSPIHICAVATNWKWRNIFSF